MVGLLLGRSGTFPAKKNTTLANNIYFVLRSESFFNQLQGHFGALLDWIALYQKEYLKVV